MGLRPIEKHPSRIISKDNNFLFFTMLQASKITIEEVTERWIGCEMQAFDWDGVTHVHVLETEESLIQIRTHYDKPNDRYCILDFTISELLYLDDEPPENPEDNVITVVSRGKTSEELQLRDELTDDNLAEVINIFKEMNN